MAYFEHWNQSHIWNQAVKVPSFKVGLDPWRQYKLFIKYETLQISLVPSLRAFSAPFQDFFLLRNVSTSCSHINPEGYIHHHWLALDLEVFRGGCSSYLPVQVNLHASINNKTEGFMTSILKIPWEFKQSKLEFPESHLAFVLRLCNVLYILSHAGTNICTSQTFSKLIQKAKSKLFSSNSTPQNRVREALMTVQGRRSQSVSWARTVM